MIRKLILLISLLLLPAQATAEVLEARSDHFTLKIEATSERSVEDVWRQLVDVKTWWNGDHTYSGDANNLILELEPGGLWKEEWAQGAVAHGEVLYFETNKVLRLSAPFGPLQGMAVSCVWTITLSEVETGTKVVFDFVANGTDSSQLEALAPAVDAVKTQALMTLTQP